MWGYDERNQLVADIFYDHGQEFIKFRNGKEILVDQTIRSSQFAIRNCGQNWKLIHLGLQSPQFIDKKNDK
jgi:hypothetical protein